MHKWQTGYSTSNLEAFVDTVRLNSFSAVARKRGMTASSIARQINALEQELGVSLFIRTTRSLALTEAGRTLFERAERILNDLADAKAKPPHSARKSAVSSESAAGPPSARSTSFHTCHLSSRDTRNSASTSISPNVFTIPCSNEPT